MWLWDGDWADCELLMYGVEGAFPGFLGEFWGELIAERRSVKNWGVLGVGNGDGVFDARLESGDIALKLDSDGE
jgi:hypothetical protein